jgi:hypothetical protein
MFNKEGPSFENGWRLTRPRIDRVDGNIKIQDIESDKMRSIGWW